MVDFAATSAASSALGVIAGAGVVAAGRADRDVLDRLGDDLRRFGSLDHRTASTARRERLTRDERALADLLLEVLRSVTSSASERRPRRS